MASFNYNFLQMILSNFNSIYLALSSGICRGGALKVKMALPLFKLPPHLTLPVRLLLYLNLASQQY